MAFLIEGLICQALQTNDSCVEFGRRDLLQWWAVPKTSLLCGMNLTSTDSSRIGIQVVNNKMYLSLAGTNASIEEYWLSESPTSNAPLSIRLPGPDKDKIYVIAFEQTSNRQLIGTMTLRDETSQGK